MASYRTIGYQQVPQPFLPVENNDSYSQLAKVFATSMQAGANIADASAQVAGYEAQALQKQEAELIAAEKFKQASDEAEEELKRQGYKLEGDKVRDQIQSAQLEMQDLKDTEQAQISEIPTMLSEQGSLAKILANVPGILPSVKRKIQEKIVEDQAAVDIGSFDSLVYANPDKDVDTLFTQFANDPKNTSRFSDDYEKGMWQQAMGQEYTKQKVIRMAQTAEKDRLNAIEATAGLAQKDIFEGIGIWSSKDLKQNINRYKLDLGMLQNQKGQDQLESEYVEMVAKTLEQLPPSDALIRFNELFPEADPLTVRHGLTLQASFSKIRQNKIAEDKQRTEELLSAFDNTVKSATTREGVENAMNLLSNNKGRLSPVELSLAQKEAAERLKTLTANEQVDAILDAKEGEVPSIPLTDDHKKAIDEKLDRAIATGADLPYTYGKLVNRVGITKGMADRLDSLAETDPNTAVRVFEVLQRENPTALANAMNESKYSQKMKTVLNMHNQFGYSVNDILAEIGPAPKAAFDDADKAYNSPKAAGIEDAYTVIKSGLNTMQFYDQPTYITNPFLGMYESAFKFHYAKIKAVGGIDDKNIAQLASSQAIKDIRDNHVKVKLNGDVIPYNINTLPIASSEFEAMRDLYDTTVTDLEIKHGLGRGLLKPDLAKAKTEADGSLVIPLMKPSAFTGMKSLYEIVLPGDAGERKRLYELFSRPMPMTPSRNVKRDDDYADYKDVQQQKKDMIQERNREMEKLVRRTNASTR